MPLGFAIERRLYADDIVSVNSRQLQNEDAQMERENELSGLP